MEMAIDLRTITYMEHNTITVAKWALRCLSSRLPTLLQSLD